MIHMVLCTRRSTHYETVFLLSQYLSQVERGARAASRRGAGRGCASALVHGEIVKLVTGEVVCNACTGVRRQHGWTCTY